MRARRPLSLFNVSLIASALILSGCGESSSSTQGSQFAGNTPDPTPPTTSFDQSQLLASVVDNVLLPTFETFHQKTQSQLTAVAAYCAAETQQSADVATQRESAQQQWREAMASWQMAEVMQIGPLLENSNSLRNKIYSWPNVSGCAVDQDVVLSTLAGYDISNRTASRKGMDALEYLLFNNSLDHSCTVAGTAPAGWANMEEQERKVARCDYAEKVATQLVSDAGQLVTAWQGTTGYGDRLKQAGQSGSEYQDVHTAVNEVSDALFYIDSSTKDAKVATPLGLFANDCGAEPCTANLESQYAIESLQHIINNLKGLGLMFTGGESSEATGFDDYLVDVGDAATADKMKADIDNAISHAEQLQQTLKALLESDTAKVQEIHQNVKSVTDSMKADFIQSLSLELPQTSAGDND